MLGRLDGSVEDNVLTLLCWNEQHSAQVALQVEPSLFSTRAYQKIAQKAIDYLEKYRTPPRMHLQDLLEDDLKRGEEGRFLRQILDAMVALEAGLQPAYVLEKLDDFISIRKLSMAVESASDALQAGDLSSAQEVLFSADIAPKVTPGTWLHDTDKWLSFLAEKEDNFISSGIDTLDDAGVVPAPGELFLIIGPAGSGKSWSLIQIGKRAAVEHHKKVLHITLENGLDMTQLRYTQAFFAMTNAETGSIRVPRFRRDELQRASNIDFNNMIPEQVGLLHRKELIRKLQPFQRRGKLLVQWFPTGTLTLSQLNAFLDSLERIERFKPDVLILDYADLMHTDEKNLRISTGRLFQGLRGIAGSRNLAMITATQGNRISSEARVVTTAMVAEDWSKIGTADTVITICRTPDEEELGMARIFVAKARNSKDKWMAAISQSYATGQFCLDSAYMNKVIENAIRLHTGDTGHEEQE